MVVLEETTEPLKSELPKNETFKKLEKDAKLTLKNIFFATAKAELLNTSFTELEDLVTALKTQPNVRLLVSGHTDNTGNAAANQTLSTSRAQAVVDFLIKKGIAATRLEAKGFGSAQPVAPNTTDAGKAQNRRVELKVL